MPVASGSNVKGWEHCLRHFPDEYLIEYLKFRFSFCLNNLDELSNTDVTIHSRCTCTCFISFVLYNASTRNTIWTSPLLLASFMAVLASKLSVIPLLTSRSCRAINFSAILTILQPVHLVTKTGRFFVSILLLIFSQSNVKLVS